MLKCDAPVNNGGLGSLGDACLPSCRLNVTAHHTVVDLNATLELEVAGLTGQEQVLVVETTTRLAEAAEVVKNMNAAPNMTGHYWLRLLHAQPRELASRAVAGNESLLFLSVFSLTDQQFVSKSRVGDIIR